MYCTLDDIKKMIPEVVIIQLTDDTGSQAVDTGKVDEAIAQAQGEIDAYVSTRYAVPLSPAPDILRKLCVDIAIYNLYSRLVELMPATRRDRYNDAISQLNNIAKGLILLAKPDGVVDKTSHNYNLITSDAQIFSRFDMENF